MLSETIHIQSTEAREKIVSRFCKLTAMSALPSVFIYLYLKIYLLAAVCGLIGALFIFFVYLNKKSFFHISRPAIIVTTNIGVLFFSMYLGYDSGIYLYLFASPLLVYLLYNFSDTKLTISLLFLYAVTFVLIFLNQQPSFSITNKIGPEAIKLIYTFNFCSAFILCFGLMTYFANNNEKYIANLIKHRRVLEHEVNMRNKSEALLKKSLNEREVLLAEVHHRVKNNLAIISALINLQEENLKDNASKQVFEETKNRIYAMSLIHNLLYQNKSFSKIDFGQYIGKFCEHMKGNLPAGSNIVFEQKVEDITMDIKTAIPLGLILNELVTNSIKHAFHGHTNGKIEIGLSEEENNQYEFWVADSGVGMDEELLNKTTSTGMDIVHSLVEQIDGQLTYVKSNGSNFTITLPVV